MIKDSAEPFQIYKKGGVPSGLISDILFSSVSKSVNLIPKNLPFNRMIKEMKSGKFNPWVSYGSKVWSSPQSDNLSDPAVIDIKHDFLTKSSFKYESIKDLFGKRVILIRGFQYPGLTKYIQAKQIETLEVSDHKAAIRAVMIGRGHAFPEMKVRLKYHIKKNRFDNSKFAFHEIPEIIPDYKINLCFSKDFPADEKANIEKRIKDMIGKKEIKSIIDSYIQ